MIEKPLFNNAAIFGVGLIGGSIARVLKNRGLAKRVVGVGRTQTNLKAALDLGIIDAALSASEAAKEADFIVLCSPVLSIIPTLEAIAPHIKKGALVTDGGSTKKDIVEQGERIAAGHFVFIGSHPVAGTEKSGAVSSFETLFDNHVCIITPTPHTPVEPLEKLTAFLRTPGMRTVHMDPARHDTVMGAVSHLPHLVAYALVSTVSQLDEGEKLLDFAAGGFKDTTRIASSPPDMWADIALANKSEMLKMSAAVRENLAAIESAIQSGDREALMRMFQRANEFRGRLKA